MEQDGVSYSDLDAELVKEFEAAFERCVTITQAACIEFAHNMGKITGNPKYDQAQRGYISLSGVRVMEQLAYHIFKEYAADMPGEMRKVFNTMYPDHVLMMEAER